jgi:outer membrane protein OmpA-like peptidoglycan-associated protein
MVPASMNRAIALTRAQIPFVLLAAALFASSASAQQFQPGQDVIVNPAAAGGNGILLYPGGKYMRVLHPLRQPGDNAQIIHLHMPTHRKVHTVSRRPKPAKDLAESAPVETPPVTAPKPVRHHKAAAAAADSFANLAPETSPETSFEITQAPATRPANRRVAKAAPPPTETIAPDASSAGLTKHSTILFAAGAPDPAANALGAIKFLASDLNAALGNGDSRIQIRAYGGAKGDKSTDARRLSLKRALSIRQVLIDDGVPADRIDVRAMGGADDGGPADRVDVYIKA